MEGLAWVHLVALLLMVVMLPLMMWSVWLARRRAVRAGGRLLLVALRPRYRRWALLFLIVLALNVAAEWLSYTTAVFAPIHPSSVANSSLMLIAAIAMFQMGGVGWRLEFCEAGIVDHALFAAWNQIREFQWVADPAVLRVWYRGRGPVLYGIAVEQREAVDELLRTHVVGTHGTPAEPPSSA
jgi:hypothetical protein